MGLVIFSKTSELKLAEGISARIVTAESMTVAHVTIKAGAILPEHSHHNEQVVNVVEGELELTVNGEPFNLTSENAMVIAPDQPHSGRAITDCKVIDVFHPVREDFRQAGFSGYEKKT